MNKLLFLLISFISLPLLSQQKLQLIDKATHFPVDYAEIQNEQRQVIATTDSDGHFQVQDGIDYIIIEHPGFPPQSFSLPAADNKIYLDSDLIHLKELHIVANDDKSLSLIKKVIENQKKNSPTALDSYQFSSYTKFTVDANGDSIPIIPHPETKGDSLQNDAKKRLENSMLFISERAIEHYYDRKYGKKNKVEAARISGLQTPLYEIIALQPLSYEFNQDNFDFFFRKFPNPISKLGLKSYNFSIIDTIQQENKSYIELNFNSKKKEKKSLHGYLMIEKESYALSKFFAENETKSGSDTYIEVVYTPYNNVWIPAHQVFKLESNNFRYQVVQDSISASGDTIRNRTDKTTKSWIQARTTFSDFTSPVVNPSAIFKGYENQVDKSAFQDFEETIPDYRKDALNLREKTTYIKLDSIGKAEKIDRAISLVRLFTQKGWLSVGKIDVNVLNLLEFNDYEDYRLGLNLRTGKTLSHKFGLNTRLFYGIGDNIFKYGLGGWYNINANTNAQIFVDYSDDITPFGRFKNPTADMERELNHKLEQSANNKYIDRIMTTIGYRQDLFQKVNFELSLNTAEERSLFNYRYQLNSVDHTYKNNTIRAALRYAPREKNVQTPIGKFSFGPTVPHYYLMIDQGVEIMEGDFDFTRFQFSSSQQLHIFNAPTRLNLRAGKIIGEVPVWHYFDGPGRAKDRDSFWRRARFGGSQVFETMAQGEFISDQFIFAGISQQLGTIKFGKKISVPYNLVYKAAYGTLENKENHTGFDFQEMDDVYQEVGLEFNRILYNLFGIGFYYRLGAYNQDDFGTDFSVKAIFNFSLM